MLDVGAASLMKSCGTLQEDDLNTSDHLPQSVCFEFSCEASEIIDFASQKVDWSKAVSSSALSVSQSEVSNLVSPLLNGCWESIHHLNDEVEMVVNNIERIATETLPNVKPRMKRKNATYFKDSTLKSLCAHSKSTWHEWCDAGRPQSGTLF